MSLRPLAATLACCLASTALVGAAAAAPPQPDFGPNVKIFDPSMSTSQIKAVVDPIANQQLSNEFGGQRLAPPVNPGTYGSPGEPLDLPVRHYNHVAGPRRSPDAGHGNRPLHSHHPGLRA